MNATEQIRADLLAALTQLGQLRPNWRMGQTLANLAITAGRLDSGGVWELEDEEALAAALKLIRQYSEIELPETESGGFLNSNADRLPLENPLLSSR